MEAVADDLNAKLAAGFQMVLVREADASEISRLRKLYDSLKDELSDGKELLDSAKLTEGDPRLVVIASVLLNLDETLMKP